MSSYVCSIIRVARYIYVPKKSQNQNLYPLKKQGGGAGRAAKALPRAFSSERLQNLTSSKLAFYKVLVLKALPTPPPQPLNKLNI
jgi:hypothetical protein